VLVTLYFLARRYIFLLRIDLQDASNSQRIYAVAYTPKLIASAAKRKDAAHHTRSSRHCGPSLYRRISMSAYTTHQRQIMTALRDAFPIFTSVIGEHLQSLNAVFSD
jgi:hypothetical protein